MKKIVVAHGVGKHHGECDDIARFCRRLSEATAVAVELYVWDSPREEFDDPRRTPGFKWVRDFMHEAIRDFAHVARNKKELLRKMPKADMYFGHSGGSVLASSTGRPCVMTGAPAQLVKDVEVEAAGIPVLNIMHWLDPIAAVYGGAENVVLKRPLLFPIVYPPAAHTSYWKSKTVVKMTADWFRKTVA